MMLGENDLGFITPHRKRPIDVFRPGERIANFGAAKRVSIVQGVGDVFGGRNGFLFLYEPQHLSRCFRPRSQKEFIGQTIDDLLFACFLYEIGWGEQRNGTG